MKLAEKNAKTILFVLLSMLFLAGACLVLWRVRREMATTGRAQHDSAIDAAAANAEMESPDPLAGSRPSESYANDGKERNAGKQTYGHLSRSARLKQKDATGSSDALKLDSAEQDAKTMRSDAQNAHQALRWFRRREKPVERTPPGKILEPKSAPLRTGLHWMRRIDEDADGFRSVSKDEQKRR